MELDEAHKRLLIGCRAPARMLVIDTQTVRKSTSVDIVGDTDDLFYDPANARLYVIGGQGFVDVFEQKAQAATIEWNELRRRQGHELAYSFPIGGACSSRFRTGARSKHKCSCSTLND